jgi:hypothetical protein
LKPFPRRIQARVCDLVGIAKNIHGKGRFETILTGRTLHRLRLDNVGHIINRRNPVGFVLYHLADFSQKGLARGQGASTIRLERTTKIIAIHTLRRHLCQASSFE